METYFAPAKRTERRKFKNQISSVSNSPLMKAILQIASGLMLVLNDDRQVVAVNHGLMDELGISDIKEILGLRFGEVMTCIHAEEKPNGCGTTPHCISCGAAIALMACLNGEESCEQICSLNHKPGEILEDLALLIRAQAIRVEGQRWILFFARDISREHFWTNLERVFFHDISNLLASVLGNAGLLEIEMPENPRVHHIHKSIIKLCNEISLQRTLSHSKKTGYELTLSDIALEEIREELHLAVDGHALLKDRRIKETWPGETLRVKTDLLLVSKVLGNMVLNALEATPPGDAILITVKTDGDAVTWQVWNPGFIPVDVQKRIFQRYFSTKGNPGRGLGTYSMKLFGETYLKGRVGFHSDPDGGTEFSFTLPF